MLSLATRGWQRKPPPGVLPRIDQSHPLARGGLFWFCNEGGGSYLRDTTNQYNLAALTAGVSLPTWQQGGWSCNGDGTPTASNTTGAASTPGDVSAARANITTGFSVWAWFKTGASRPTGRQMIFGKSSVALSSFEWELEASESAISGGNYPTFVAFNNSGAGTNCTPCDTNQLLANTEYQLLGVYGVTFANLFINGRPGNTPGSPSSVAIGTQGAPVNLGGRIANPATAYVNTFNGTVYATGFWPYALGAAAALELLRRPTGVLQAKTRGQIPAITPPSTATLSRRTLYGRAGSRGVMT